MSYQPVLTSDQIATIAANVTGTGFNSQEVQAQGMQSFEATNLTDAVLYVLDETGSTVGILPPNSDVAQALINGTRVLVVRFDPDRSGSAAAFTATNAWQVWIQPSPAPMPDRVNDV